MACRAGCYCNCTVSYGEGGSCYANNTVQHFARPEMNLTIFILNYIAMIPAANLLGFAGQELARKLPLVLGVILETTFGSLVEIVLFMVLIHREHKYGEENAGHYVQIIRAAILGSILANMLLALGACFLAGGIRRKESEFHDAVSEVGTGLMLVAGCEQPLTFGGKATTDTQQSA